MHKVETLEHFTWGFYYDNTLIIIKSSKGRNGWMCWLTKWSVGMLWNISTLSASDTCVYLLPLFVNLSASAIYPAIPKLTSLHNHSLVLSNLAMYTDVATTISCVYSSVTDRQTHTLTYVPVRHSIIWSNAWIFWVLWSEWSWISGISEHGVVKLQRNEEEEVKILIYIRI